MTYQAARPLNCTLDQAAADHARLFGSGMIGYCPVCARPVSNQPTGAIEAMALIARHLNTEHDGYFIAQLRSALTARDPFYPTGDAT